jgi:carbamoyltransferase
MKIPFYSDAIVVELMDGVELVGRLQAVYRHTNPRYYRLIETFCELTWVPLVLNTSFNENEPVLC